MNKKLIVALIVVVVIAGGVWAYFAMQPNASAPENGKKNSDNSRSTSNEIAYTDDGFSPDTLSVKVGTTIKIKNQSSGPLQFSSDDHPTHTKNSELNMQTLAAGEEATLELTKTGEWGFHNHLKSGNEGTITVTE